MVWGQPGVRSQRETASGWRCGDFLEGRGRASFHPTYPVSCPLIWLMRVGGQAPVKTSWTWRTVR